MVRRAMGPEELKHSRCFVCPFIIEWTYLSPFIIPSRMKSAYELAMERMGDEGGSKPLTDEQKEEIAQVDSKYKAKIAERKIFLDKSLSEAIEKQDHEEAEKIRRQLTDETARFEDKAESEKEKIRNS